MCGCQSLAAWRRGSGDEGDQRLWWVDIRGGLVHCFDLSGGDNATYEVGEQIGCLARREAGGLVIATESGLYLFDPDDGEKSCIATPEADLPGNRFNDGGTDPRGALLGWHDEG